MTVYYQHIGEVLWARDAPKSIGTPTEGVVRIRLADIEGYLNHLPPSELLAIISKISRFAPTGFQIWGLPEGARDTIRGMDAGDFLLLLESIAFQFAGQILHRMSEPCWDLSRFIWGEQRFPQVVLLQGEMINYPWQTFCSDFNFASNYHMRGNTMKLSEVRLQGSRWHRRFPYVRK